MTNKEIIARRAAEFFHTGDIVNLGIGIPSLCAEYSEPGVFFQSENGYLGTGGAATGLENTESYCNASGIQFVPIKGGSSFDSAMSFSMIRGGRVDATVLGALQVSEHGDLANWASPGRAFGMGGAMDLVNGAKKVIVAMEMTTKSGAPKILHKCTYPLTGAKCVDYIVTECALFKVTEQGLVLTEIAMGHSLEEICKKIEPDFSIVKDLRFMNPEHQLVSDGYMDFDRDLQQWVSVVPKIS